jgi:hypothetical protein
VGDPLPDRVHRPRRVQRPRDVRGDLRPGALRAEEHRLRGKGGAVHEGGARRAHQGHGDRGTRCTDTAPSFPFSSSTPPPPRPTTTSSPSTLSTSSARSPPCNPLPSTRTWCSAAT